jgi:hypothetical protein
MKLVPLVVLSISFLVYYQNQPHIKKNNASTFNEKRAFENLLILSKQIGPKVVGTRQEKEASEFIISKLKFLETCLKQISKPKIIQNVYSGANSIQIGNRPPVIVSYSNVTNIIMYLEPFEDKYHDSFLVSSHYDSGITSPGFYDDGVPVVVQLEVLQNLCDQKIEIKHPLIFLFNGAEEMGLLGSSAFMKYDELSKNVSAFINLESAGTGGRNFIFQAGNTWIMKEFSKSVVNVKGNVVGQDIFEAKVIPSETDYKVYKMKEKCVGIDTAFYQNGHVYHTHGDSYETFEEGSILHMGENVEMFTKHMASLDQEYDTNDTKSNSPLFFDFLSLHLFVFSMEDVISHNYGMMMMVIGFILFKTSKFGDILRSFISLIATLISGVVFSVVTASILSFVIGSPMHWYSLGSKYCILFYTIPTLIGFLFSMKLFRNYSFGTVFYSVMLFWDLILLVTTFSKLGSSFIPVVSLYSLGLAFILPESLMIIILVVPTIVLNDLLFILIEVFSAIMGRSFSNRADVLIALLVSTLLFFILINFIPILYQSKLSQSLMKILIVLWIAMLISSVFIFPYSKERPKRVSIQHIINYENETTFDSFVALISSDAIPMGIVPSVMNFEEKKLKLYPIPTLGPPSSKATGVFKFVNSSLDKTIPELVPSLIPKYIVNRNDSNVTVSLESNVELFSIQVELKSNCSLQLVNLSEYFRIFQWKIIQIYISSCKCIS